MDLKEHLRKEHNITPFSTYLREIVFGGNDGIVTTFAVVAGFTGAAATTSVPSIPFVSVLLFGIANLFADGLSMSLGSFLSLRADQDVYRAERAKENYEIKHEPDKEFTETVEILKMKGFSPSDAKKISALYRKNEHYWTEFMMRDELDMPNPFKEHALFTALATFFSFVLFGTIPLLPYVLFPSSPSLFPLSVFFTSLALILLGLLRALVTQRTLLVAIGETLLVGGTAASVAYFVGTLFRG